jgi:NADH:ubiquinone oxidoreductase subunit 3 (subunit A)
LSAEIVALLILVGAIVAAVVFTLVIVVAIDPSDANRQAENEGEKDEER